MCTEEVVGEDVLVVVVIVGVSMQVERVRLKWDGR
jgi:hypothetical protein